MARGARLRGRDVAAASLLAVLFAWVLASLLLPRHRSEAADPDPGPPLEARARAVPDLPDPVAARAAPRAEETPSPPLPAAPRKEAPERRAAPEVAAAPASPAAKEAKAPPSETALLEGSVVYPGGHPRLVRAVLLLARKDPAPLADAAPVMGTQLGQTEDGAFRFDGLAPGTWKLYANVENPGDTGEVEVHLVRGERKHVRLELRLAPNAGLVRGRVSGDLEGRPGTIVAAHGTVRNTARRVRREVARVEEDGEFEVRLGAGLYRLQLELGARAGDPSEGRRLMPCAEALVDVPKESSTDVKLSVAPAVTITRTAPGAPPSLWLAPMDPASAEPLRVTPNAEGEYIFSDVAPPSPALARRFVLVPQIAEAQPWPPQLVDFEKARDRLSSSGATLARIPLRGLSPDELDRASYRVGAASLVLEAGSAVDGMIPAPREIGPSETRVFLGAGKESKMTAPGWTFLRWRDRDPPREEVVPSGRGVVIVSLDGGGGALQTILVEPAEVPAPADGGVYASAVVGPSREPVSFTLPEGSYRVSIAYWGGKRVEVRDRDSPIVRLWAGKEQQMLMSHQLSVAGD